MKQRNTFLWSVLFAVCFVLAGCEKSKTPNQNNQEDAVRNTAEDYFATFSERKDWDKLCSFYREDVHFKDIVLQLELDSLWKFKKFYRWDEEGDRFKKLFPEQEHLNIESLVVDRNTAVAKGKVNPFYYDGFLMDTDWGMEFTIWLTFDDNLKIIKQVDWMEYDPYTMKNVVTQYEEKGFESMTEWLGLP